MNASVPIPERAAGAAALSPRRASKPAATQGKCHSALVRVTHWLTTVAFLALLVTGGEIVLVEATYVPGESSPPHSHPCPAIAYVLEGTLREKVTGKPEIIYKADDSFYEAPNSNHEISANASQTKPAKFLAHFVCDRGVPLSVTPPTCK
jgi:quercetin dioxygenase-like cupin family protein